MWPDHSSAEPRSSVRRYGACLRPSRTRPSSLGGNRGRGSLPVTPLVLGMLLYASPCAPSQNLGTMMPVGDSITDGDCSYNLLGFRDDLASLLEAAGVTFTYVGDLLGEAQDPRYPGHFVPGARIEQFYPSSFGNGWGTGEYDIGPALQELHPDVLLVHLGTNNINPWNELPLGPYSFDGGQTLHRSLAGYAAELLAYVASFYPAEGSDTPIIVLCRIIPKVDRVPEVLAFNEYLEEMALDMAAGQVTGKPVHVVVCDQFGPFIENPLLFTGLPGDYLADGVHPNDLGYAVMANSYLASLLDNTPPAAVTDLVVACPAPHALHLFWTAPGDDHWSGTASSVLLRVWDQPIEHEAQFAAAWELAPAIPSAGAGSPQEVTVEGLPGGRTYWVALRVSDDAGNLSSVSNSPSTWTAPSDTVLDAFDGPPAPGVWDLGSNYFVAGGMLRPANPFPTWLPPAPYVGESDPVGAAFALPGSVPVAETELVGLVVLGAEASASQSFVLRNVGGLLELRSLAGGVMGAVVDTAQSRFGPLGPGASLGAMPFVFEGHLLIRATRDGLPDRVLSTGLLASGLPSPRFTGVLMRGGLAWGIDAFRLEGPGLWQPPLPFHVVAPESGAVVDDPPMLVWRSSHDPDPWDEVSYEVLWATFPNAPPALCRLISCANDTSVSFPSEEFEPGRTYYWRVRARDGTGLEAYSTEREWWFRAAMGAAVASGSPRIGMPSPNPTDGVLFVTCETPTSSPVVLQLHDLTGRRVACHRARAEQETVTIRWVLPSALAPGPYLLSVRLHATESHFLVTLRR